MSRRRFLVLALIIFTAATTLRTLWLRADPPTTSVGIVWHDEGAWVHNARNKALWGAWRADDWNPMFIAPVFTALEYGAFRTFGVGTWQARIVPVASGLAVVLLMMAALYAMSGWRVALIGATLVATNYVFVMWNRAALMESTMTALIVASWAAYAHADRRPILGAAAGLAAVLACFTKASAAFFLAALALEAALTLAARRTQPAARGTHPPAPSTHHSAPSTQHPALSTQHPFAGSRRAAWMTLGGLTIAAALIGVLFVLPNWTEYRFYNVEMSVLRKPSYGIKDFVDRASWLPVVQDFFSRMWLVVVGAAFGLAGIVARWRTARPAERLLAFWVLVGLLELTIHDSGNERRYVMFIPALIALAALFVGSDRPWMPGTLALATVRTRWLSLPLVLLLGYLVLGSVVRLMFLSEIRGGSFYMTVRVSAALAALVAGGLLLKWPVTVGWLSRQRVSAPALGVLLTISVGWNLFEYWQWARHHGDLNYRASVEVGRALAAGTLVQGKLANGLSLENQIRPLFIGRGFGNDADRLVRDDVRYILTYVLPEPGYESQDRLIEEILVRYPRRRIVRTFDVDETTAVDRAALIDKFGDR